MDTFVTILLIILFAPAMLTLGGMLVLFLVGSVGALLKMEKHKDD